MMLPYLQQNYWAGQSLLQWLLAASVIGLTWAFSGLLAKLFNLLIYRAFTERNPQRYQHYHQLTGKPMRRFLVIMALYVAFTILNIPIHVKWFGKPYRIHFYLDMLLQIGLVWYATQCLLRIAEFVAETWKEKARESLSKTQAQWIPYIKDGIKIGVILSAFLFVIGIVFQANIAALVGGLGIGGLAVALAAQESLANLLGSFTIVLDKPFNVGDIIEFKGITGTVEQVGFRSTRIRTLDKSYVTVPNKALVTEPLNNITESTHRRAAFQVGLVYQTQPETLRSIIKAMTALLEEHPLIEDEPTVTFYSYGESSLDLQINYLVKSSDYNQYLRVREEINFGIYEIVNSHQTQFAFPTRTMVTVHE